MKFDSMIWKTNENREPSSLSYFRLGWVVLDVPPSNISIEKSNDFASLSTLRSTGDVALKSGYSSVDIVVSVPFFGEQQVLNKLLPIIAMYKVTPIVELDNKFIRSQLFGSSLYNKIFMASPFFSPLNPIAVVLKGFELSIGDQNLSGITVYATLKLSYYNHFPISPWFEMRPESGLKVWQGRIKSYIEKLNKGWDKFKKDIYEPIKRNFPNGKDFPGLYSDQEDNDFTIMGYVYKCVENFHPQKFGTMDILTNPGLVAQEMYEEQTFGDDFDRAYCAILHIEQGLIDNPKDPGGITKYGISKRAHPNLDIRNLTCEQARAIAKRDYWDKAECGNASWPMNLVMFDKAFCSGDIPGAKALKAKYQTNWKAALEDQRQRYLRIANDKTRVAKGKQDMKWAEKGWMNRVNAIENACLGQPITQFPKPPKECSFCNTSSVPKTPENVAAQTAKQVSELGQSKSPTDVMDTLHKQAFEQEQERKSDELQKHKNKLAQLYAEGWEPDPEKSNNDYLTLRMSYYLPFYYTYNDALATWSGPSKTYFSKSYKSKLLIESITIGFENKFVPIPIQSFSMPFWQHLGGSSMFANVRATAIADPDEGYCAMLSDLQMLFNIKEHQVIDLKDMIAMNPNFTEDVQSVHIWNPALNMLGLHKFIMNRLSVSTNPSHIHTYDVEMSMVENYMYAPRVRGKTGQLQILEDRILPNVIKKALMDTPETDIVAPEVRDLRRRFFQTAVWSVANCAGFHLLRRPSVFAKWGIQALAEWCVGDGNFTPTTINVSDDPQEWKECLTYTMVYNLGKIDFEYPNGPAASLEDTSALYIQSPAMGYENTTYYADENILNIRPYLATNSALTRSQFEKWKTEGGWPCGAAERIVQAGDCTVGKDFISEYEKAGILATDLKDKLIDVYQRFSATEPCFIKLREQFKTGNVAGSKYWNSFFADGKIFTPCYPDLELPDLEDPAAYIDGVAEPPPDAMANVYSTSQKVALAMANKIEQHYASMPQWKITGGGFGGPAAVGQAGGQTARLEYNQDNIAKAQEQNQAIQMAQGGRLFADVNQPDISKSDDMVKASFMAGLDGTVMQMYKYQSYNRSFPTFRIYFIEDNAAFLAGVDPESISRFHDWDQFFDYEAVVSIEIAKFKWDVDTAIIRVLNTFGELSTRVMDAGTLHTSEANRDVVTDGDVVDYKHKSKRLADGALVLVEEYGANKEKDIVPMKKIAVQAGTKIMIKLGYQNNEYLLPVSFSGLVAKVENGEMMTIICQGHLAELLEPVKGFISEAGGTGELLQRLFGFDEGFEWTSIGKLFSAADWKRRAYKTNINSAYTRPLAYRLLSHPSVIHFGRWQYLGSKYNGTSLYAYGSAWRLDQGQSNRSVDNVDVLLEQNWQAKTALLGMYPAVDKFWVDNPEEDALWDVFREITLRHPSHRLMVRPYQQDATLVIKQLGDMYKQGPASFSPSQEASVTEKNMLIEFLQGPGGPLLHTLWSKISSDGRLAIHPSAVDTYLGQSWQATVINNEERKRMWDYYVTNQLEGRSVTNATSFGMAGGWMPSAPGNPFGYHTFNPAGDPAAVLNAVYLNEADMKTLIQSERNLEVLMICMPPELMAQMQEAYTQFKAQKMRADPSLAATVSMGGTVRPVQKYFYASSYFNIIFNNIRTNADIYNAVTVKDKDGVEEDGITVSVDDNLDTQYLRQFYFSSKNVTKHWYTLTARLTNDLKHLMGWSLLIEKLNEMYQGELCILGEPDIMPFDCIILNDAYNQLYGPVEVNSVVHRFSSDEGFITFIEPHLCARVADLAFAVATGRMTDLYSIATQNEWYYNLDKKYKLQGGHLKGIELGPRGFPLYEGWIMAGRSLSDSLLPDDMQGVYWGANTEYYTKWLGDPAAALGIHIDRLFAGVSDTFYNSGPFRQPVIISPLRFKNIPFVAGIRGAKFNSWAESRKLQYERENVDYANQIAGFNKGLRLATEDAPVGTDASTHTISQGREIYSGAADTL